MKREGACVPPYASVHIHVRSIYIMFQDFRNIIATYVISNNDQLRVKYIYRTNHSGDTMQQIHA
jgi:hypothetical protein